MNETLEHVEKAVRAAVTGPDGEHRYLSTYCVHRDCPNCRVTCKCCGEPCICSCHRQAEAGTA